MEKIQLSLNDFLLKIKETYNISNNELVSVLNVSPGAITSYLTKRNNLSLSKAEQLNSWLMSKYNKSLYDFIFSYINEDGFLFHGSKSEIIGKINVEMSSEDHDFGKGFYLGESFLQSSTWVSSSLTKGNVYQFKLNSKKLKSLELNGIEWILYIAISRKIIEENSETSEIFKFYKSVEKEKYDIIIGKIADDRMSISMDSFFSNRIKDIELYECLTQIKIGNQFCIKTKKGAEALEMISIYHLDDNLKEYIERYAVYLRKVACEKSTQILSQNDAGSSNGMYFKDLLREYRYGK